MHKNSTCRAEASETKRNRGGQSIRQPVCYPPRFLISGSLESCKFLCSSEATFFRVEISCDDTAKSPRSSLQSRLQQPANPCSWRDRIGEQRRQRFGLGPPGLLSHSIQITESPVPKTLALESDTVFSIYNISAHILSGCCFVVRQRTSLPPC